MSEPTWDDIEAIFHEALAQDGAERSAYLQSVSPELRQEVQSLLEASEDGGPLDKMRDQLIDATIDVPTAESIVGSQICQYKIGELLGGGGMGAVYRAEDQRLGRTVALKFLLPHLTDEATAKQRFIHEAQAAARLEHPNICTILEVGESPDGKMFIAMPLYHGVSLRARLKKGPLALPDLVDYAGQICAGLNKAHEQGIVHRDIKPENIFITTDGVLKILDFGIAKFSAAGLTGTGAVIGTLAYMSPEQASSQMVDHRSDIWSLGVMMFEMACGQAPFRHDNALAMINTLVNKTPPTLDSIWPEAPPSLSNMIQRALQKRPADRYQSVIEVSLALDDLRDLEADTMGLPQNATAILPEGERRLATVLVTHIHDYDTMVESLSPTALESIREQMHQLVRQCVARHGGVVNQTSGAEIISLFGVPTTHEDDILRAVRAARAMAEATQGQSALQSALQSGIDSGYVIVQSSSNDEERYRIVGNALHTATRIAEDAGSSEVLVAHSCLRSLSPFFTIEQGADVRLKGGKSCSQHRIVAETGRKTRLEGIESHRLTQYAGRSTEFETLTKRYRQALAGSGQFVSVVGDAGLGKSRFLHEFSASINTSEVTVLQGGCQSFSDQIAYYPFMDLLQTILELPKGSVATDQLRAARTRLGELDADLLDYFPFLLQALSIDSDEFSLPRELRKESLRATISEAVASLIMCRTAQRPVVLLFEDWHWVDAASAEVLQQLVRFAPSHAILIVLTHRPSLRFELGTHAHHTAIQLYPLDLEESSTILKTLLGTSEVSAELADLIHERAGGNPFFLEEICESLLEQCALQENDKQSFELIGVEDLKIPDTVQGVIRARLDRMNRNDREVLCFASVIGRDFDKDILGHVYTGDANISESLERLCLAGLIQPTKIVPRPSYRFKHALTQEVTYESLLTRLRQELHGLVGSAIVELRPGRLDQYFSQLALHFAKAEHWLDATKFGLKSAKRAWRLTEFQESLKLLEAAEKWGHKISDEGVRRQWLVPILLRKERAFEHFGSRRLQHAVIDELLGLLDPQADKQELVEVYIRLGDLHTLKRDFTGAEDLFNKSLALCEELGDENGRRKAMRSLGLMMWHADRGEDAITTMKTALAESRAVRDDHQLVMDMVNLSTVYRGLDRIDECHGILAEADDIANKVGDTYGLSYVRHNIALIARQEGRLEEAIEILLSLLDNGKITKALPQQQGFHLLTCANIYLQLGRTDDATASWERAIVILRRAKHVDGLCRTLVTFAEVLLGLNRPSEARDHLVEAKEISAQLENPELHTNIFHSLGLAHAALKKYPDAIAAWGRARALCQQQGNLELELDVVSAMAQTTRELVPEPTFALQYYRDAIDLAKKTGSCKRQGALYNTVGIIEWQQKDFAAALVAYELARGLFEDCDDHDSLGLVLSSVGVTLHKLGRPEATVQLQAAVAFNQEHGNRQLEGLSLSALGDVQAAAGHPREAIAMYNQSLGIRRETHDRLGEAWMLHHLARAHAQLDALDRTRDFVTAAQKIAIELDNLELLESLRELSN